MNILLLVLSFFSFLTNNSFALPTSINDDDITLTQKVDILQDIIFQQQDRITQLEQLVHNLASKIQQENVKVGQKQHESHNSRDIHEIHPKLSPLTPLSVDAARVTGPTGCLDLWKIGYTLEGFFPVIVANKLKIVYCNRADLSEVVVGYADVKSIPVSFLSNRPGEYKNNNNPIIISYTNTVEGNPSFSGSRFIAPVTGVYQFSFDGHTYSDNGLGTDKTSKETRVTLLMNSVNELAWNYASSDNPVQSTLSTSVNVGLNAGDYVETRLDYGNIRDCRFTGVLLEGEIVF